MQIPPTMNEKKIDINPVATDDYEDGTEEIDVLKITYATPAEDRQQQIVNALESKLNSEILMRNSGFADNKQCQASIEATKKQLVAAKQLLKKKQNNAVYEKKHRHSSKRK